jgi:hypothetical protein
LAGFFFLLIEECGTGDGRGSRELVEVLLESNITKYQSSYSIEVSLNESEEIFLRFDCSFSSYIFFLTYSSDSYFGSSIFTAGAGSAVKPLVVLVG